MTKTPKPKPPVLVTEKPVENPVEEWTAPELLRLRLHNVVLEDRADAALEQQAKQTLEMVAMRSKARSPRMLDLQNELNALVLEDGKYETVGPYNLETGIAQRRRVG